MNDDEIIKKYFDWEETLDNDFEIDIGIVKELMIKAREDYVKSEDVLREIYSWGLGEINPEFLDILAKRIKKIIPRNQSPEKREAENVSGEKGGSNKTIAQEHEKEMQEQLQYYHDNISQEDYVKIEDVLKIIKSYRGIILTSGKEEIIERIKNLAQKEKTQNEL